MPPSSEKSAQPLRLEPGLPLLPLALLLAGHAGALLLLFLLSLRPAVIIAAATLLGWSCWRILRRYAGGGRITTLIWHADGRWETGEGEPLTLIPPPYVSAPLVILNFSDAGGRRRNLLLTAASSGRASLRRLRVRLLTAGDGKEGGR